MEEKKYKILIPKPGLGFAKGVLTITLMTSIGLFYLGFKKGYHSVIGNIQQTSIPLNSQNIVVLRDTSKPKISSLEERVEESIKSGTKLSINQPSYLEGCINKNIEKIMKIPWHRNDVKDAFSRLTSYDDYIKDISEITAIPENLIRAVLATESEGKRKVISRSGAVGLAQLRLKTARDEMGVKIDRFTDGRYDPYTSIITCAQYLKKLNKRFNNPILTLIAYNAGPTEAERIRREYGSNPGWTKIEKELSDETRNFVIRVLSREILLSEYPHLLNIKKQPLYSKLVGDSLIHEVKKGETLYSLSKSYNIPKKILKQANPEIIDYGKIPAGHKLRIPKTYSTQ